MRTGRPSDYQTRTTFTISLEAELLQRFRGIAERENKEMNRLIQEYMKKYINEHGSGNEQYKIDQWYQESEFKATPAFLESHDKWEKYIGECNNSKELARIQGQAADISQKAKQKYMQVFRREMFNK